MKKFKRIVITDHTFSCDYLVQRGGLLGDLSYAFAKKLGFPSIEVDQNKYAMGRYLNYTGHRAGAIWLSEDAGAGTIAHEVCHAANYLFRYFECKSLEELDEPFAYYVDWLVREIVKKLY